MILNKEEDTRNRENARTVMFSRLDEYHGAMWAGVALSERANTIRVLKLYPKDRSIDDGESEKHLCSVG